MAFVNRIGNMFKQSVSRHMNLELSASKTSLYQAIRSMSSSKLFVGGLSYGTDETSLKEAFSQYGEVIEARVILDRDTGRSRGFGFVSYTSTEEASSALQALDGQDLHGRRIRVNYATERRRGGFGGGYGSGGGFNYGGGDGNFAGAGGYATSNYGGEGGGFAGVAGGNSGYGGGGNYGSTPDSNYSAQGSSFGGGYGGGNSGNYYNGVSSSSNDGFNNADFSGSSGTSLDGDAEQIDADQGNKSVTEDFTPDMAEGSRDDDYEQKTQGL